MNWEDMNTYSVKDILKELLDNPEMPASAKVFIPMVSDLTNTTAFVNDLQHKRLQQMIIGGCARFWQLTEERNLLYYEALGYAMGVIAVWINTCRG